MSHTHRLHLDGDVVTKTYVNWSRNEHVREWTALRAISAARPQLVPVPIRFTPPTPYPSIIMSRLPGTPLAGCLSPEELEALHVALTDLWSIPPTDVEPLDRAAFFERIRSSISSWDGAGIIAEAHQAATEWLAAPTDLAQPAHPVIGHGDPNLANYLWDGQQVRIIDFEDAGRSDLALELATLVEHIASRATDWTTFVDRFTVDPDRFRSARRLHAIFWLALLRPGSPAAHRNPPGTGELQAERVLELLA
ncbi:phosphotransferase family protein [Kribbella sp. CA-253562]|uniref:phosphotransferase family protein n=1 Tax=Kribbella sp. CA-253562 TaxID=3239942 RepID=UPI003D8F264A